MRLIVILIAVWMVRTPGWAGNPSRSIRFVAEEMVCELLLVNAEDGSSVGFFVTLINTSADNSYRLEGQGHQLILRADWLEGNVRNPIWKDASPSQGESFPAFWVDFAPRQRSSFFVSFTALMTKPLPVETVNDWEIQVRPYLHLAGAKRGKTGEWQDFAGESRRFESLGDETPEFTGLTLRRTTLEGAAWRYAPQNRKEGPRK